RPDIRDPGGDQEPRRRPEEERGVRERLPAEGFGDPEGAVSEGLDLQNNLGGPRRGDQLELERPDADFAEVHPTPIAEPHPPPTPRPKCHLWVFSGNPRSR